MKSISVFISLVLVSFPLFSQPVSLHPENLHYFLYLGKPTVLITSGEHYGSVINPDQLEFYMKQVKDVKFK